MADNAGCRTQGVTPFDIIDLVSHEGGLGGLRDGRLPLYVNSGLDPDRLFYSGASREVWLHFPVLDF